MSIALALACVLSAGPVEPQARAEGPPPPPTAAALNVSVDSPRPERKKGNARGLLIAGGVTFGAGVALQWGTLAHTGRLGRRRQVADDELIMTLGMAWGGTAMGTGALLTPAAVGKLGKDKPKNPRLSKGLVAAGAVATSVGAASVVGVALAFPMIRAECPIDLGCPVAALDAGAFMIGTGASMIAYGRAIGPVRPRRRLPRKAEGPIIAGATLLTLGLVPSLIMGSRMAFRSDDDRQQRMGRRAMIPVVGPWIVAAGPDAPLLTAMITGGLGALQIGGAAALVVGGVRVGLHRGRRRQDRSDRRAQIRDSIRVAPSMTGFSVRGRF